MSTAGRAEGVGQAAPRAAAGAGRPRVVVLGGGFSGAAFAVHLLRAATRPVELVIVEPRARLGAGLAYGAAASEHRINVPSDKMILFREDPGHLTRWVRAEGLFESDPDAVTAHGHHYLRRSDFARYMAALVEASAVAAAAGTTLRHCRALARGVQRADGGYRVHLDDGAVVEADALVVTASHEAPSWPWPVDAAAAQHPGLVRDPWTGLAGLGVASLGAEALVVAAGTGLTMCDLIVSLRRRGYRGRVLAISRRGLLPRVQGVFGEGFDLLQGRPMPLTARELLRCSRAAAARASDWREALDAVRLLLPSLWHALPLAERRRALRWLRPWWDVHRFRMAPQVAAVLAEDRARGALQVVRGRIHHVSVDADGGLLLHWTPPGGEAQATPCAAFVNCTGPVSELSRAGNPLIRALLAEGLAVVDPVGIGLACDADGRLRGGDGLLAEHLCVAGPLARAAVAEVTGVPEASAHARRVAERLAADPALWRPATITS